MPLRGPGLISHGLSTGRVIVRFDQPERAVAIGQAVVLYDGDTVVGGGTIREAIR